MGVEDEVAPGDAKRQLPESAALKASPSRSSAPHLANGGGGGGGLDDDLDDIFGSGPPAPRQTPSAASSPKHSQSAAHKQQKQKKPVDPFADDLSWLDDVQEEDELLFSADPEPEPEPMPAPAATPRRQAPNTATPSSSKTTLEPEPIKPAVASSRGNDADRQQIQQLREQLQTSHSELDRLKQLHRAAELRNQELQTELQEAASPRATPPPGTDEEASQLIEALKHKLKQFREHANQKFAELNTELQEVRSENEVLRHRASSSPVPQPPPQDQEVAANSQAVTQLERQLERTEQQLATSRAQLHTHQQELGDSRSQAIQLQAELHQAQMDLQASHGELQSTQVQLEHTKDAVAQITARLHSSQSELAEAQARLQEKSGSEEINVQQAVQRYKTQARARFEELQDQLQSAESALQGHKTELQLSRSQTTDLQGELVAVRQQLHASRQSCKLQEQKLAELQHSLHAAQGDLERESETQGSRLQKLQQQLASARQELEQARATFSEERGALHQQIVQLHEQAERAQVEASQHDIDAAVQAFKAAASARFDQMRKEGARLQIQLEDTERELTGVREQLRTANSELEELRVTHTQTQQQMLIQRRTMQAMENKLQSQVELGAGESRRVQQLTSDLAKAETQLVQSRRESEELTRRSELYVQKTQQQRSTDLARIHELDNALSLHIEQAQQNKVELAQTHETSKRLGRQLELLTQKYAETQLQLDTASQQLAAVTQEKDAILERSRRYVSKTSEERLREREQLQSATQELAELRATHTGSEAERAEAQEELQRLTADHAALQDRLGKYVQQNRAREQQQTSGKREIVQKTIQRLYQALTSAQQSAPALIEEDKVYDGHQVHQLLKRAIKLTLTSSSKLKEDRERASAGASERE